MLVSIWAGCPFTFGMWLLLLFASGRWSTCRDIAWKEGRMRTFSVPIYELQIMIDLWCFKHYYSPVETCSFVSARFVPLSLWEFSVWREIYFMWKWKRVSTFNATYLSLSQVQESVFLLHLPRLEVSRRLIQLAALSFWPAGDLHWQPLVCPGRWSAALNLKQDIKRVKVGWMENITLLTLNNVERHMLTCWWGRIDSRSALFISAERRGCSFGHGWRFFVFI